MGKRTWVYNPHSGGVTIPSAMREKTERRIRAHAEKHYSGRYTRLDIRFRGALCYIDAFVEPAEPTPADLSALRETREQYLRRLSSVPVHLCRIRYFGNENAWSMSYYTYSHERYEPCVFHDGSLHGTPEEAFDVGMVYL
jgi:hypothetical protein